MLHLLFIHIPKTAGTSFRFSAQEFFGKKRTFFDYSPTSVETSQIILDEIYKKKDPYAFYGDCEKEKYSFLSGHFPTEKYAPLYQSVNIISFVREPVARVLSHYAHFCLYHGYTKPLDDFIQEEKFQNVQAKNLAGRDLSLYGFLGITEEYDDSLDLFEKQYGIRFKRRKLNVRKKKINELVYPKKEIVEKIKELNKLDLALYEKVKIQLETRKQLYKSGQRFTYGFIQILNEREIRGVAFQRESDKALEIDIYMGKIFLETISACKLRSGLVSKNVPRKGYVGFDYQLPKTLKSEGKLRAFVKETNQEIT
jgi:hypothetical protein